MFQGGDIHNIRIIVNSLRDFSILIRNGMYC